MCLCGRSVPPHGDDVAYLLKQRDVADFRVVAGGNDVG